jgi:hypothetical protein
MSRINLKPLVILLVVCFGFGLAIDCFTKFHWLPASLTALFAFLVNGMAICIEDREPGGWDYDENESQESKKEFMRMVSVQAVSAIVVFILAMASYVYTRS